MRRVNSQLKYLSSQSWYQRINLTNGLITDGKISVSKRMEKIGKIDFFNKTVLDIGCNSGGNTLWAKKFGARKVVGIDKNEIRISQAKKLASFENTKIDYRCLDIFEYNPKHKFDIIMCFAVITEIQDLVGVLIKIKNLLGEQAYLELNLAKPKFYFSTSRTWLKGFNGIRRTRAITEIYQHKVGLTLSPSIELVQLIFGADFVVEKIGKGERYDLIKVFKKISED